MCGGCCPRFSLDYLPTEPKPNNTSARIVEFNYKEFTIYSDMQKDHSNKKCRNLRMDDGRCNIHTVRPFSCDFELIRFLISSNPEKRKNVLTQKLFGRGWMMQRVDGERGALCEMTPIDLETVTDVIRKLNRLKDWTTYFNIKTKTDIIIDWINQQKDYNDMKPLVLDKFGNVI
jgi:Fe-S-cluster containining protein